MWLIALKAIIANVFVIVAAFGFGSLISRFLPDSFSRFTRFTEVLVAGFGLLGLAIFLVGHLLLTRWTIGLVLACGAVIAVFSRPWPQAARISITKLPAAIVGTVLLITAVSGLAEPVGSWEKDGVAYHLVGPKVWLRNGVIRPIADNMNTSYPCTGEMVFTAMWAFGGDRAPGFSAVWTLGLLFAIAASLARRCGLSVQEAWWVAAIVATMPAVYPGGHSAFVDVIYATFVLAAVRIVLDATESRHFATFGILCGLAMATKCPALLALPVLIFCVLWSRYRGGSWRIAFPQALTAVVAISLTYGSYMMGIVVIPNTYAVVSPKVAQARHRQAMMFIDSFDYVNRYPDVTKLLILDPSVPAYYSDKPYVKPFGQWGERPYPDVNAPNDILQKLREFGISHVLDVESTIAGYQVAPDYPGLKLAFTAQGQRIYRVLN
jgi:hypothetical protein